MSVIVNGTASAGAGVLSGIPQGSVLGPTLFVLYVNDIPRSLRSHTNMLADDLKLLKGIANQEDSALLQADLDQICLWCATWLMPPNATKCLVLHAGNNNPQLSYHMTIDGNRTELAATEVERDLGVHIDCQLTFDAHVNEIVKKCNKILWLIKRSVSSRSEVVIKKLYCALVRPHLEYCGSATILRKKEHRKNLERIQRRATKLISNTRLLPYQDRLRTLNLPSLHYRRTRGDLIQVFKYQHGLSRGDIDKILPRDMNGRTRGHSKKLLKPRARTELRRQSFSHRVVGQWNNLREETVNARTLNCFKARLDRELAREMFQHE